MCKGKVGMNAIRVSRKMTSVYDLSTQQVAEYEMFSKEGVGSSLNRKGKFALE